MLITMNMAIRVTPRANPGDRRSASFRSSMTFCRGPVLGAGSGNLMTRSGRMARKAVRMSNASTCWIGRKAMSNGGQRRGQDVRDALQRLVHSGHPGQMLLRDQHGGRCLAGGPVECAEA